MPRHSQTRAGLLILSCLAVAVPGLSAGFSASAEPNKRVARRASTPVSPGRAAPDVTGTIKMPAPAAAAQSTPLVKNDDDGPLKPFDLPAAPRARMRQCGESWQKIKLTGEAGDRTWREFATTCLRERETQTSASSRDVSSNASR